MSLNNGGDETMLTTLLRTLRVKRAQVGGRKQLIPVFSPTAAGRVPGFRRSVGHRQAHGTATLAGEAVTSQVKQVRP